MVKEKLLIILKRSLEKSGIKEVDLVLDHPGSLDHGDYSTNIALKLAKKSGKNPKELAEEIASNIDRGEVLDKIEVVNGFINFFLAKNVLFEELNKVLKDKQKYGKKTVKKFTILLEFGQPNTHKTPHVGHLFSYIYGESLARVLENEGNKIIRANYQGDIGPHVAKCIYIAQKKLDQVRDKSLKEKVDFLQKCYVEGSELYEKDERAKKEIDRLNGKIYTRDPDVAELWKETRGWSLEFYKQFEQELGINYDKYYFESETADPGKEIVLKNVGKVFVKSEGAIIFRGDKYGLHTRVFVNKLGNPTYEAKDIGLIAMKVKDLVFDLSLVTTANEQSEYWKVIIAASEAVFPRLEGKLKHLGFGMINLATGKMSSRKGMIIDAFALSEEVKNQIKKEYDADEDVADKIAQAAVKYSFLKSDVFKNITFDLNTSISREGDSGPYLLYSYVRTLGLLKGASFSNLKTAGLNREEEVLLRTLYLYPEVIEKVAKIYSPHLLVGYLFDLAQKFNYFYQKHPILKSENKNLRLALSAAVGQIIRNGLLLLGIEVVDKM